MPPPVKTARSKVQGQPQVPFHCPPQELTHFKGVQVVDERVQVRGLLRGLGDESSPKIISDDA